jgi:hypothetical protein
VALAGNWFRSSALSSEFAQISAIYRHGLSLFALFVSRNFFGLDVISRALNERGIISDRGEITWRPPEI